MRTIFVIMSIIAIIYTSFSIYMTEFFEADVKCQTYKITLNNSYDGVYTIYQEQKECDDFRKLETKIYIRNKNTKEKTLVYSAFTKSTLKLITKWKANGTIEFYLPLKQEKFNEKKYSSIHNIIYINFEKTD